MSKRATFTTHGAGAVTIEYTDAETDIRESRTFVRQGRYIYELLGATGSRQQQMCEGLTTRGVTLMADDDARFQEVIRREYKKMRRAALARVAA